MPSNAGLRSPGRDAMSAEAGHPGIVTNAAVTDECADACLPVDAAAEERPGRSKILVVGVLAALVIVATAITATIVLRESARRDWAEQLSNLSLILSEQASQTLFSAHTVLRSLADVAEAARLESAEEFRTFAADEARYQLLIDKTGSNPIIDVATFVSNDGDVLNFTRSFPPPRINLSDRDYFIAHRADKKIKTFTSVPVRNKGNGKWVFYITRRINNSNGDMLGMILVGISVEVFSRFYERVATSLGDGASISLYRGDFALMTRWPLVNELVGKKNLASVTRMVVEDRKLSNDVVFTELPRMMDGNKPSPRIVAPRLLDRYPFIVVPVVTEERYLRNWRNNVLWITATAASSLLLLFIGVRSLLRADRKVRDELVKRVLAQDSLRSAHEQLEFRVQERTSELTRQILERKLVERELTQANSRIAAISHKAGMSEVANSVLHNVGNVLNSVSVSVQLLNERLAHTPLADFPRATALLNDHRNEPLHFLTETEQGRALPNFLDLLSKHWVVEHQWMLGEAQQMKANVQQIKEIVSRQQSLSGHSGLISQFSVREVVKDALSIHGAEIEQSRVKVVEDHERMPDWKGDRSKIAQIILNLVANAEQSLAMSSSGDRTLSIRSWIGDDQRLEIRVSDNGVGMTPYTMNKLFTYGFTTKSKGHGFGLHASAQAAQDMDGILHAFSEGEGLGATFFLSLPPATTSRSRTSQTS